MQFPHATLALVLTLPALGACATKGWVRGQMAAQRASIDTTIVNTVASERDQRIIADNSLTTDLNGVRNDVTTLRTDLNALRGALDSLRTEFGARITAFEDGIRFAFPVHFAFNDATVRDTDRTAIERFASVAQKYYPGAKITVEGFADPAGGPQYNQRLSRRRADAVRAYLEQNGLQSAQLTAVGYGETRLVVPGAWGDRDGAELNRRVVFVVEAANPQTGIAMSEGVR